MNALFDVVGPAVWRASWQASALAVVIGLVLWALGERLSPRWRYLFWSVVVVRLLLVVTPVSPWSLFNLARWNPEGGQPVGRQVAETERATNSQQADSSWTGANRRSAEEIETRRNIPAKREVSPAMRKASPVTSIIAVGTAIESPRPCGGWFRFPNLMQSLSVPSLSVQYLSILWLAGCLASGLQLSASAVALRRRLAVCRPVTDGAVLDLLDDLRQRIGLKRSPALLVTPESVSPCFVGTWNPRIIVPESMMTGSSTASLRHVLAHELAHLVRGDLWTNWLLLAVRVLHWFNPVAWWMIQQMQAEREAACDEVALGALGETNRNGYAQTIIDLAAHLAPSGIVPGMIGLFSSKDRLRRRVERLVQTSPVAILRAPIAAGLLVAIALSGLTDKMPAAAANQPLPATMTRSAKAEATAANKPETKTAAYKIRGRCIDNSDNSPQAGIRVLLFEIPGKTWSIRALDETVTDASGRFEFADLLPPSKSDRNDSLIYEIFAVDPNSATVCGFINVGTDRGNEIRMIRESASLSGKVVNAKGQPVAGATVTTYALEGRTFPGVLSTTTAADGRFTLEKLPVVTLRDGSQLGTSYFVIHPDYPETAGDLSKLPAEVTITMPDGCTVTGHATDSVQGRPSANALITSQPLARSGWRESYASTDAAGRFRMVLPEGRYTFLAESSDRISAAITDRECTAGAKLELPPIKLTAGGLISGQVVDTSTGEPVSISQWGQPITLGLYGPSRPPGRVISPVRLAIVDANGRFTLRAAPGANYPYFINTRGDRMAWDTAKQPPVVVKEGETTAYNMLITPPVSSEKKLTAARALVASLPKQPAERTARILSEFRKFDNRTFGETELWSMLTRELAVVGPAAVPQICDELDRTTQDFMLRRLAFALRAIGDPRAVPALIRAIPNSLTRPSSDFGLIVGDQELTAFMQRNSLGDGHATGRYFNFGRPVREIFGTLQTTGQDFDDSELFRIHLSEDPRRQVLQRRLYRHQALRWQSWWEKHWKDFTQDPAFQKVNLPLVDEALPAASSTVSRPALSHPARLGGGVIGQVLSPASEEGQYVTYFFDLDTGYQPKWPTRIPNVEGRFDDKELGKWAAETGVDLMCVTRRSPDGTETFALRAFDMRVWEIGPRTLRNLDRALAAGKLPEGRLVGELLMHYDSASEQLVADANAAFLFVTREGNMGLIETTDRVTTIANLTGKTTTPPKGVGYTKGVRFNLKEIIP
jgi:beta-lactamase regulating signal transducer with metallopeptidase domain/5-hydroxyisourate hydrolase-like protein (transthyretin family)